MHAKPLFRQIVLRALVLFPVALLMVACNKSEPAAAVDPALVFKTLSGQQIAMGDQSGPVLVNFWSVDCPICLREMPEMAELYHDYQDKGFDLVAVAMPYDAPNRVLELAESQQWPFPVALDIEGHAVDSFATVKGTPTSYLIDADGKLVKRYVGAIDMKQIRKQLDKLLGLG